MTWLIVVSFIWAFSFGLIKGRLTDVDSSLVSLIRVSLALIVFLPLLRTRRLSRGSMLALTGIGAVQFGLMYVTYIAAFQYLESYQIAILTIFTPLFVCLIDDLMARRFRRWPWIAAAVATAGAGIIVFNPDRPPSGQTWAGVGLMQASNLCFAFGQVAYRRWRAQHFIVADRDVFALLYLGAVAITLPAAAPAFGTLATLTAEHWLTLLYLGLIASGLGFFLWNYGAVRTNSGSLAVMNNLKIPLTVAVSLLVFGERADAEQLALGGTLVVAAGLLAEWSSRRLRT